MDPAIRSRVARALQSAQAASAPRGALYAVWLCGEKLVSMAQPRAPSHRLTSRDLVLLTNFVATQPALRNAESWTPVCFPRFQETVRCCYFALQQVVDDEQKCSVLFVVCFFPFLCCMSRS